MSLIENKSRNNRCIVIVLFQLIRGLESNWLANPETNIIADDFIDGRTCKSDYQFAQFTMLIDSKDLALRHITVKPGTHFINLLVVKK